MQETPRVRLKAGLDKLVEIGGDRLKEERITLALLPEDATPQEVDRKIVELGFLLMNDLDPSPERGKKLSRYFQAMEGGLSFLLGGALSGGLALAYEGAMQDQTERNDPRSISRRVILKGAAGGAVAAALDVAFIKGEATRAFMDWSAGVPDKPKAEAVKQYLVATYPTIYAQVEQEIAQQRSREGRE